MDLDNNTPETADEAGAAELAHLQERFLSDAPAGAAEVCGPDPVDTVAATFRPMAALLSASSPVCAAFYTEEKVQEIARMFVMLAEAEGWDVSRLESRWALRISFVLVALPPQAIEWTLNKLVAFAVGGHKVAQEPEREQPIEVTVVAHGS